MRHSEQTNAQIVFLDVQVFAALESDNELEFENSFPRKTEVFT